MTKPQRSSLSRLVLFMVCLSVAGLTIAGVQCLTTGFPHQNSVLTAPYNNADPQELQSTLQDMQQNLQKKEEELRDLQIRMKSKKELSTQDLLILQQKMSELANLVSMVSNIEKQMSELTHQQISRM